MLARKINITLVCLLLMISTGMPRLEESPRVYCGRVLAHALSLHCERAKVEPPQPKGPWPTPLTHFGPKLHEEEVELIDEVEEQKPRQRRSIVEVCCENPCYLSQLLSFCKE